jgi:hypothetical protein
MIDLGRPWRIYYPMFISWGTASVMFLVEWHVTANKYPRKPRRIAFFNIDVIY